MTGVAPQCNTIFAVAAYVMAGIVNSSPGPTPYHRNANSQAAVQLEKQASCGTSRNSASSFSNAANSGPEVIQPERNTRLTAAMVSSSMGGGAKPMGFKSVKFLRSLDVANYGSMSDEPMLNDCENGGTVGADCIYSKLFLLLLSQPAHDEY
jgi:hypothetical protein